jgi:hypothetical protein
MTGRSLRSGCLSVLLPPPTVKFVYFYSLYGIAPEPLATSNPHARVFSCAQAMIPYEVTTQMQILNVGRSLRLFRVLRGAANWIVLAAFLVAMVAISSTASAQVVVSVRIAPPVLPIYTQPICPGDGYIWTPGYWAYSDDGGYYWVPGTWVEAPEVGLLWTPGYWGWADGLYAWNAGYWGPQVGFYGGIDYGFGYIGIGYAGGYWNGGQFFYNSQVNNVNVSIVHNVYQKTVVEHVNHVSFNGGKGGISARPTAEQEAFAHEHHVAPSAVQVQHEAAARADHNQFASVNHGHPVVAATARPGEFKGSGVVAARGAAATRAGERSAATRAAVKPRAGSTTRAQSKARTETKPKEAKPEVAHEPKAASKPHAESTPRAESKPPKEAKAPKAAKPPKEAKPEVAHESKPAAKPRAESTPSAESKPPKEAKPPKETKPPKEPKPEVAHESKPAPKPHAESTPRAESKAPKEAKPPKDAKPPKEPKPEVARASKPPAEHAAPAEHQSKAPAEHAAKPPAEHESAPREEKKPPKS